MVSSVPSLSWTWQWNNYEILATWPCKSSCHVQWCILGVFYAFKSAKFWNQQLLWCQLIDVNRRGNLDNNFQSTGGECIFQRRSLHLSETVEERLVKFIHGPLDVLYIALSCTLWSTNMSNWSTSIIQFSSSHFSLQGLDVNWAVKCQVSLFG